MISSDGIQEGAAARFEYVLALRIIFRGFTQIWSECWDSTTQ